MIREMRCPKCEGEMREGELFITVRSGTGTQRISMPYVTGSTLGIPAELAVIGEGPFWRERTGQKIGWLVKRDEKQTLKISGLRCTECGYIELYVHK